MPNDTIFVLTDTLVDSVINTSNALKIYTHHSFQNNVSETFLGMSIGLAKVVVPTIISLLIFSFGIVVNWSIKKIEKSRKLNSEKTSLTNWISLLKLPILNQVKFIRNFTNRLLKNEDFLPERLTINNVSINNLKDFKLIELTNLIVTNSVGENEKKSKDLFNIISQIDFLNLILTDLKDYYKVYYDYSHKLLIDWNEKLKVLHLRLTTFMNEAKLQGNEEEKDLANRIYLLHQYLQTNYKDNITPKLYKTEFLDKIHDILAKANIPVKQYEKLIDLELIISEMNFIYRSKIVHFEGNSKVFKELGLNLIISFKALLKSGNNISERKIKCFCRLN